MDLHEIHSSTAKRHPWELARARVLQDILIQTYPHSAPINLLDIGCGDGFIIAEIFSDQRLPRPAVDAVDTHLTSSQAALFEKKYPHIHFHNSLDILPKKHFHLITALDVIEHQENDQLFLQELLPYAAEKDAYWLITAPAFNRLFSGHDRFLQHFRRYSRRNLNSLVCQAGCEVVDSGYYFSSLIPLRLLALLKEKIFGNNNTGYGIGQWKLPWTITRVISSLLYLDYRINRIFQKITGRSLPGLSVWTVCKKRQQP